MAVRPLFPRGHQACWLMSAGMAIAFVSCGDTPNNLLPVTQGGAGTVISLDGNVDGGRDARPDVAAGGAAGGGRSGSAAGSGGATGAGGRLGVGGSAGSGGAAGAAAGGGGGGGPADDPCTACEKAECGRPAGLTADATDSHSALVGAYEVCFLGTGWPSATADPANFCGGLKGETGTVAVSGPESGTAKTTLCQAILKCVHQTSCTGGEQVDNQFQCYCGANVSLQTCTSPGFTATGVCMDQVAAGLESTVFSTSDQFFGDLCLANGAAFFLYDWCDANCCEQACLGVPVSGGEDPSYCNAPGSAGASGSGGSAGSGGTTGFGGANPSGGASGSGGIAGAGGSRGAAGSGGGTGAGASAGSGGSLGSGGSAGSGGSTGAGGTSAAALQNVHFDTNTQFWAPSLGATLSRSSNDAAGSAQSGSLDLVVASGDPTLSTQASGSQCIAATPGASYSLGVQILIPGQVGSQGALGLWYYASTDCSGAIAGVFSSQSSTTNSWQKLASSTQIPAGVHSMAVRLVVLKPYGQQSAEALFDNVVASSQ